MLDGVISAMLMALNPEPSNSPKRSTIVVISAAMIVEDGKILPHHHVCQSLGIDSPTEVTHVSSNFQASGIQQAKVGTVFASIASPT